MNAVGRWVHRGLLSPTSSDVDQLPASTDSNGAQAPCPMPRTTAAPYAASHSRTLCREPGRSKLPAHHGRFRRGSTGSCDPQTPGSCRRSADPCRSLIGATRSTIRRLEVAGRFIRSSTSPRAVCCQRRRRARRAGRSRRDPRRDL